MTVNPKIIKKCWVAAGLLAAETSNPAHFQKLKNRCKIGRTYLAHFQKVKNPVQDGSDGARWSVQDRSRTVFFMLVEIVAKSYAYYQNFIVLGVSHEK